MTTNKLPAFHVGEYLADELRARDWSIRDLAERMAGDTKINEATIAFTLAAATSPPGTALRKSVLGRDTAERIAAVFGTNAETWLNLDSEFHKREFGDA